MYNLTGKENPSDFIEGNSSKLEFSSAPPIAAVQYWLQWGNLLPVANGAALPDLEPVLDKILRCLSFASYEFVFDLQILNSLTSDFFSPPFPYLLPPLMLLSSSHQV